MTDNPRVLDHVTIRVSDREASRGFYETVLASLGHAPTYRGADFDEWNDFSLAAASPDRPLTGNLHVAFVARSRADVDAFWSAAVEAGYRSDGEPGPRPIYHRNYYGGFLLDPDDNSVEAVHHADMRGDPSDLAVDDLALTGMQAGADLEAELAHALGDRVGTADRACGPSKRAKKPSPAASSSAPRKRTSSRRIAPWCCASSFPPGSVAELRRPRGRAGDVREENRGEDTLRLLLLPAAGLPLRRAETPRSRPRCAHSRHRKRGELYWLAGWLEGEGSFVAPPPSDPRRPRIIGEPGDADVIREVARLLDLTPTPWFPARARRRGWARTGRVLRQGGHAVRLMSELAPLVGARRQSQIDRAIRAAVLTVETAGIEPACAAACRSASTGLSGASISPRGSAPAGEPRGTASDMSPRSVKAGLPGEPVAEAGPPPHGPRVGRLSST